MPATIRPAAPAATIRPAAPPVALREALLADRARVLTDLYRRAFPAVRRHVVRHGGAASDAEDVFQDALLRFYEQAVGGTLVLTAAPGTYLVGVARHLWQHELRRRARLPHAPLSDEADQPDPATEAAHEASETTATVLDYVERLGAKCRSVLLDFYYFQQPLAQITAAHGYGSVRSATVQKFKCLERLRQAVRSAFASETLHA